MTLYLCILYIDISIIVFIHTYLYIHIFIYVLNDSRFIVFHNSESIHSWSIQLINLGKAAGLDIVFARLGALILNRLTEVVEMGEIGEMVPSLKLAAKAPEKLPKPKRKGLYSNHTFSGASC